MLRRPLLALVSAVAALLLAETALRLHGSDNVRKAGTELRLFGGDQAQVRELYELDDELGFRPVLPSAVYGEHGALRNEYGATCVPGKQRLLLVGDSVAFRGRLLRALRERFGEERFEWWNGGVSAFNTEQEVAYFRRQTRATHPDQVVLVFHPNDFQSTPISFLDRDGHLQVVTPAADRSRISPFLFRYSHLYRWFLTRSLRADRDEACPGIRAALVDLGALCREDGSELTVLVLPHLMPREQWSPVMRRRHAWILATTSELGLRTFDLAPALDEALAAGLDVQETPGDHAHPSDAVCAVFAGALAREGFLAP